MKLLKLSSNLVAIQDGDEVVITANSRDIAVIRKEDKDIVVFILKEALSYTTSVAIVATLVGLNRAFVAQDGLTIQNIFNVNVAIRHVDNLN